MSNVFLNKSAEEILKQKELALNNIVESLKTEIY